jgi:hypothetical protein
LFVSEALGAQDCSAFASGHERIDRYFRETVSQDIKRSYAACYGLLERSTRALAGFYTYTAGKAHSTLLMLQCSKSSASPYSTRTPLMNTTHFSDATKASIDTLLALNSRAFQSVEELAALNVQTAALLAKRLDELLKLQAVFLIIY